MKRFIACSLVLVLTGCTFLKRPPVLETTYESEAGYNTGETILVKVKISGEKIVDIKIDELHAKSADGTKTASKKALAYDYGLKNTSKISKEWNEQIEALELYIEENGVESIILDSEGYTMNNDLKTSCTIKIQNYIRAVEAAIQQAQEQK